MYKVLRILGHRLHTMQYMLKGNIRAILCTRVIRILRKYRAIQIETRKQTLATRVRQELSIESPIRSSLSIATHGTGRSSSIATDLELRLQHILQTMLIHRDQYEIRRLATDLPTKATASQLNEDRSRPSTRRTAGRNTLSILRAHDEGTLLILGNHDNARCPCQDRLRNALVWCGHNFLNYRSCIIQSVAQLRVLRTCGNHSGGHRQSTKYTNCFFHGIASQT